MGINYNGNNYRIAKGSYVFDTAPDEVATKAEMETYILNMEPANITASGADLIIEFEPFPKKYINYIAQRQYNGRRTQVFWQLVRYVGHKYYTKTYLFYRADGLRYDNLRRDPNNDLYHWTFPTRQIQSVDGAPAQGTMKPYHFNISAEEAMLGRIIWANGNSIINRFKNRPFGVYSQTNQKQIAVIIGVGNKGMLNTIDRPLIYKKSNPYLYTTDEALILKQHIEATDIYLNSSNGIDYSLMFSNVHPDLLTYAATHKNHAGKELFLQTFDYRGGVRHKQKRGELGQRKKAINPAKPRHLMIHIGAEELTNGVSVTDILPVSHKNFRPRYKYEPETFHNVSVALVLANSGMNEGFHTYKESNKVNIL